MNRIQGLVLVLGCFLLSVGIAGQASWHEKVTSQVLSVYTAATAARVDPTLRASAAPSALGSHFDSRGNVQVDVHYDCAVKAPLSALKAAGLKIGTSLHIPPSCVVEGWVTPAALSQIASVPGVKLVKLPAYAYHTHPKPTTNAGTQFLTPTTASHMKAQSIGGNPVINGNAVAIMHADQYITQTQINGAGVTVGVLSNNVNSLSIIQGRGELPSVQVLAPSPGGALSSAVGDEGTMMLEEVYAVAPGAALAFCAPDTAVDYQGCLMQLIAAGATIIVDDLAYPTEDLMTSNSDFELGVQGILAQNANVALFTVSENYNGSYWEGPYQPLLISSTISGASSFTCSANGQVDSYLLSFSGQIGQILTVNQAGTYNFLLQWADPYGANVSNFDLYYVNATTNASGCLPAAGSSNTFMGSMQTLDVGTYYLYVATPDASLAGKFMKMWINGDGATSLSSPTSGSVISAQAFVPGVNIVGAVDGSDGVGNIIESYSGLGPIHLMFPVPIAISAPTFVAPDSVYVDAVGTNFPLPSDGLFHGTSAASPNVAAVAALIRSAFPSLTPAELTSTLQSGATYLGGTTSTFGSGRVDAMGALATIPYPTMSGWPNSTIVGGTSSPIYSFTVSSVGNLRWSLNSSNTALIPNVLSPQGSGTPGVSIGPANCGQGETNCTISFTPAMGQVGTLQVEVINIDGAYRTSSILSNITVTKPAMPTVQVTTGASQSFTVGGSPTPIAFTLAGTGTLSVTATASGPPVSGVSVNSGCGGAVHACTATLTATSGATGSATVTVTATDPYGQAATGTATMQVNPEPSKGGGGAMNLWAILALGAIATVRVVQAQSRFELVRLKKRRR
jgi:Subtilase family